MHRPRDPLALEPSFPLHTGMVEVVRRHGVSSCTRWAFLERAWGGAPLCHRYCTESGIGDRVYDSLDVCSAPSRDRIQDWKLLFEKVAARTARSFLVFYPRSRISVCGRLLSLYEA